MCRHSTLLLILLLNGCILIAQTRAQEGTLTQLPTGGEVRLDLHSVSISGSTAGVAGMRGVSLSGGDGVAAIYEQQDDEWVETFFFVLPCDSFFGCPLEIAIDGNRAVVGGSIDFFGFGLLSEVQVFVLEKRITGWEIIYDIPLSSVANISLDLDGDQLLVSREEGDVLLYELGDEAWSLVDQVQVADGRVVGAIDSGRVLVGESFSDATGAASVIDLSSGTKTELRAASGPVGGAVSLNGNQALVAGSNAPQLFRVSGNDWLHFSELENPSGILGFGSDLSVDGNLAIVGSGRGQAWLFQEVDDAWVEAASFLLDSEPGTRVNVDLDGVRAIFGARGEAWVYVVPEPSSGIVVLAILVFAINGCRGSLRGPTPNSIHYVVESGVSRAR